MLLKVLIIMISFTIGNSMSSCPGDRKITHIFRAAGSEMYYLWDIPSTTWNANIKAENGNGRNALSVLHWNMGSRQWRHKTYDIVQFLSEKHPDICLISEANLQIETPLVESCIPNYSAVYPKTFEQTEVARLVALVRDGIHTEVRYDWMEDHTASIWMEVNRLGKKKLVVGSVYREQSLLGQPNSVDIHSQTARWNLFLKQWKTIGKKYDTFVVGDLNLDTLKWQDPANRNRWMIDNTKNEDSN